MKGIQGKEEKIESWFQGEKLLKKKYLLAEDEKCTRRLNN